MLFIYLFFFLTLFQSDCLPSCSFSSACSQQPNLLALDFSVWLCWFLMFFRHCAAQQKFLSVDRHSLYLSCHHEWWALVCNLFCFVPELCEKRSAASLRASRSKVRSSAWERGVGAACYPRHNGRTAARVQEASHHLSPVRQGRLAVYCACSVSFPFHKDDVNRLSRALVPQGRCPASYWKASGSFQAAFSYPGSAFVGGWAATAVLMHDKSPYVLLPSSRYVFWAVLITAFLS